jgi:putative tricarboxylic transport membrane protein
VSALRRAGAPLAGLAVAVALLWSARDLDQAARAGHLGPGFWPRLGLIGLAVACAAQALAAWRARPGPAVRGAGVATAQDVSVLSAGEGPRGVVPGRLTLAIVALLAYAAALPALGFAMATAAFVAVFMRLAGWRGLAGLGAGALGGTVLLLYVFVKVVYVPLPKGWGPCETLTVALYRALRIF